MKRRNAISIESLGRGASESMRRLNPSLFGGGGLAPQDEAVEKAQTEERTRLDSLNKTERRYYDDYLASLLNEPVIVQPPRLFELTGGGTYTPDFVVVREWGLEVVEIKGGYRGPGWEQGIERYRRVAAQYDCERIRFLTATWDRKQGRWNIRKWKER